MHKKGGGRRALRHLGMLPRCRLLMRRPPGPFMRLMHDVPLPRYLTADDAPPADIVAVEKLVDEWQDLMLRQKSGHASHVLAQLKGLGVRPMERYSLTRDPSDLDTSGVLSLLRQQPSLKRTSELLALGVKLEQPSWRHRGTAEGIDLDSVHALLGQWDELRLQRRFDEADRLKEELWVQWDVKLLTKGGRRQFRRRRRGEENMDEE